MTPSRSQASETIADLLARAAPAIVGWCKAGIRWLQGWRGGEEVIDSILWKYEFRRRSLTRLQPFCRDCDVELKIVYGNLNDRRLHPLWGCPKCRLVFRTMEAAALSQQAREAIEVKLAGPSGST